MCCLNGHKVPVELFDEEIAYRVFAVDKENGSIHAMYRHGWGTRGNKRLFTYRKREWNKAKTYSQEEWDGIHEGYGGYATYGFHAFTTYNQARKGLAEARKDGWFMWGYKLVMAQVKIRGKGFRYENGYRVQQLKILKVYDA